MNRRVNSGLGVVGGFGSTAKNSCATKESPKLMDGRSGAGHDNTLKVRVACAGPLPVLGPGDEAGVNGVPLNVIADAFEFGGIPNQ